MVRKAGIRRTKRKSQRGGDYTGGYGNYAFTGPAGVSAGGVPFESRAADNAHCGWSLRPAPHVTAVGAAGQMGGGRRRSRSQKGGGCGCMGPVPMQFGGGGGTGGYSFDFGNNALGKVYAALPSGPCPATPHATQLGGDASYRDLAAIDSYKTGYEFGPRGVVSTNSAHYLDPIGYDRTCRGGARRTRKHRKGKKAHKRR